VHHQTTLDPNGSKDLRGTGHPECFAIVLLRGERKQLLELCFVRPAAVFADLEHFGVTSPVRKNRLIEAVGEVFSGEVLCPDELTTIDLLS